MPQSRRSFLATLGAAAIGTAMRPALPAAAAIGTATRPPLPAAEALATAHPAAAAAPGALERVGLQLYTVRADMRRDLESTLEAVARIGYREVEFAGYFDRAPTDIAAILARTGLTAPSTHIAFTELNADWARVLDHVASAGHTWVTIPSVPASARGRFDDWKRIADLFNERARQARAAGLRFAYHNHAFEFEPYDGAIPYDILIDRTDPQLVDFQLDVYWSSRAAFDPTLLLERHPRRFAMTHLKDWAGPPEHRMVDVGRGFIEFDRILRVASANGVQHHFVEHDQPDDALRSIRTSYEYLRRL